MSPNVYIIAGPNGAGKTTFAKEFLPKYADCKNFINADLIAQGVSPFAAEEVAFRAGRLMLEEMPEAVIRRRFDRSICNFLLRYRSLGDSWMLFDNSGATPAVIALEKGAGLRIMNREAYDSLVALYGKP